MSPIIPVTNGFCANRGSRLASGTITGSASCSTAAHIESSRAQTEGSMPTAATCTCSEAVIRLITADGTSQTWAASATSACRSRRGGSPRTAYVAISWTRTASSWTRKASSRARTTSCVSKLVLPRPGDATRGILSEPGRSPQRHPATQVRLQGQVAAEEVTDLDLQDVVARLGPLRRERGERALFLGENHAT